MEKRIAHYSLETIKKMILEKNYFVTGSARLDYTALGLSDDEVIEIVLSLVPKDLYKSMTSYRNNKIWQDVYFKSAYDINLYIKLQITQKAIIISFKEKT